MATDLQQFLTETTSTDDAYLAGIVDGEGCLRLISTTNSSWMKPELRVVQKNFWFLELLRNKYPGGTIYKQSGAWQLVWSKASTIKAVLEKVYPYLVIKKGIAEVVIAICDCSYYGFRDRSDEKEQLVRLKLEQLYRERVEHMKEEALVAPEELKLKGGQSGV